MAVSHFATGNPGETVQSLQHIIAPRRPAPLDPGVAYSVNPQDSREASIASVSTSGSSIWEPAPIQPAYARHLPTNLPQPMGRHSISSQIPTQQHNPQVFAGTSTPRSEAYHATPMLDDPRQQTYPVVTIPSDPSSTMTYNMSINPFHHPAGPETGPSGGC